MEKEMENIVSDLDIISEFIDEKANENAEITVDQEKLSKYLSDNIEYEFTKDLLVKPLDVVKVMKVIQTPIATGEMDENGVEKFEIKSEEKEVDSLYRTGVIIKLPIGYTGDLKLGDTIVYPRTSGTPFDLFKDSQLVYIHAVIAIKK